jgi:hypothetical protein
MGSVDCKEQIAAPSDIDHVPLPMHERRPEWLEEAIAIDVTYAQQGIPSGYRYNGDDADYDARSLGLYGLYTGVSWMSQFVKQIPTERERPLRILDIGAGEAAFVLRCIEKGHEAQGLSFHNYAKIPRYNSRTISKLPPEAYLLGDANNLDQVEQLRDDFDLIISRWAFAHFADPISALEQATNRLGIGGVIGINNIMRKRSRDQHSAYADFIDPKTITDTLQESGFDTEGSIGINDPTNRILFNPFRAIRKELKPVRFPIEYAKKKPR